MQKILNTNIQFQFSNKPTDNRFWCAIDSTLGTEIDEIFNWANKSDIDILCMGLSELNVNGDSDMKKWFSIWSFEKDEDRTIFILKFSSQKTILC